MSQTNFTDHMLPVSVGVPQRPTVVGLRSDGEGTVARRAWRASYVRRLTAMDAASAAGAAAIGVAVAALSGTVLDPAILAVALAFPAAWVVAQAVAHSYEHQFLWEGPEEFRRVLLGAGVLLAAVATLGWGLHVPIARVFVAVALPLATLLTLAQRSAHRSWLRRQRAKGRFLQTALLVGPEPGVAALRRQLLQQEAYGYRVVGCCLPATGAGSRQFDGLPVLGGLDDVAAVVRRHEVDTVAVLPSRELDGAALRRLGWELERTRADLLLAPAVTEVVGPRVRVRPVCGLSLLQMERPELRGVRGLIKASFDRVVAAIGLLLLVPVLLAVSIAVKATSPGPVLFRQERVGRDGRTFPMLKFRSMTVGAERMLDHLAHRSDGNGVLFKMTHDPRVTRVGRFLRRYSLDELPQLVNVLKGEMSLVGPRPPLRTEVERYGVDMHRRFVVKPGLTGLWQVSGRSNLSWDDTVRIDVHYVENWSLLLDLMIIGRTFRAVLRGDGAY
jgi:exopolysaccharide biosynthesis polyprenyl glycosylphosphotransferase